MNNQLLYLEKLPIRAKIFLTITFFLGILQGSFAQNFSASPYNDGNAYLQISGLPDPLCAGGGFIFSNDANCSGACLQNILNSVAKSDYHALRVGDTLAIKFTAFTNSSFPFLTMF